MFFVTALLQKSILSIQRVDVLRFCLGYIIMANFAETLPPLFAPGEMERLCYLGYASALNLTQTSLQTERMKSILSQVFGIHDASVQQCRDVFTQVAWVLNSPGHECFLWQEMYNDAANEVIRFPRTYSDNRFDLSRANRWVLCDYCGKRCEKNGQGEFWVAAEFKYQAYNKRETLERHNPTLPCSGIRTALWEVGKFDARWFCIKCYTWYWNLATADIVKMFGFAERSSDRQKFWRSCIDV